MFCRKAMRPFGSDSLLTLSARGARPHSLGALRAYRGTSLIRKRTPLGPYRRPIPRVLGGSKGGGRFLMSEPPLYPPRYPHSHPRVRSSVGGERGDLREKGECDRSSGGEERTPVGQWLQCQANGSNVCRVLRRGEEREAVRVEGFVGGSDRRLGCFRGWGSGLRG